MSGKRERAKAATKRAITEVALELFTQHGHAPVTIRMIAKAAGVSTGSVFAHWKGKDELFAEVMGRPFITDAMGAALLATITGLRPAWEIDQVLTYAAMGVPTQDGPTP